MGLGGKQTCISNGIVAIACCSRQTFFYTKQNSYTRNTGFIDVEVDFLLVEMRYTYEMFE